VRVQEEKRGGAGRNCPLKNMRIALSRVEVEKRGALPRLGLQNASRVGRPAYKM